MKIIHTSDWHLGQNFYGYDRIEEHRNMVIQLGQLIEREEPDALIIAGDIFDITYPSAMIQKEFAEYIVALHNKRPQMTIVCISGNHDSASRHEVFQTPWEALNVKMIGKTDFDNPLENIVRISDKGTIVAVPYTNERFLTDEFFKEIEKRADQITHPDLPIIFAGHLAIQGSNFSGHNIMNDRFIGGIESTPLERIGTIYDYFALGHIHKGQTFGNGKARYCSSPIPVSFDEVNSGYEHSFSVVEIEKRNSPAQISTHQISLLSPLINIPAEGFEKWDNVIAQLNNFPADLEAYIRLNVLLKGEEDSLPYNRDSLIKGALEGKKGRFATINTVREVTKEDYSENSLSKSMTMEELAQTDPIDILKNHAQQNNYQFTEEFQRLFNIVIREINEREDED